MAGLAVAGLGAVVESAIEAGGKIYELTQKLHISAESITALHYAAEQLESSAAGVDNSLAKMSLTLGKAIGGSDEAVNAFNRLQINFQSLRSLAPDKQFLAIIDALHSIPDAAERAMAAQAIFGKGYTEINALITAGSGSIVEMGQKAVETGAVLSTEVIGNLDNAGDAIKAFTDSWAALKVQLVGGFAPAVTFVFNALSEGLKAARAGWYFFRAAFTEAYAVIYGGMEKIISLVNILLPKQLELTSLQQDAAFLKNVSVGQRNELFDSIGAINGGGGNPLAKPDLVKGTISTAAELKTTTKQAFGDRKAEEKAIADNTKETNAQLKEMVSLMRQGYSQNEAAIKVVGLR